MRRLPLYESPLPTPLEQGPALALATGSCTRCSLGSAARVRGDVSCLPAEGVEGKDRTRGLIYVIGDSPTVLEAERGRPMIADPGRAVRKVVEKYWAGDYVLDTAIRCRVTTPRAALDAGEACAPYLRQVFRDALPDRVIVLGRHAAKTVLGRDVPPDDTRKGYSWVTRADGKKIPLMVLAHPQHVMGNRHLVKNLEEDFAWALGPLDDLMPPLEAAVFHIVETVADAEEAAEVLRGFDWIAYDAETGGKHFSDFYINASVACTGADALTTYVWGRDALAQEGAVAPLRALLEDEVVGKVGANSKYDQLSMRAGNNIRVRGNVLDVQLTKHLDLPGSDATLETLSECVGMGGYKQEFARKLASVKESIQRARKRSKAGRQLHLIPEDPVFMAAIAHPEEAPDTYAYALIPSPDLERYNARDTVCTARVALSRYGFQLVQKHRAHRNVWRNVLLRATDTVEQIEAWGIGVSRDGIDNFNRYLDGELVGVNRRLERYDFLPTSPQQVAALLFDKLKLKNPQDPKSRSTDKDALRAMEHLHPIVADLREHRRIHTLRKMYGKMDAFIREDGRIHCEFKIDGTECMPAGELVLTNRGYLPVEQVKHGDQVISHTGKARKVIGLSVHAPSPIYRVRLSNGLELRTTGNHQYYANGRWVRADELRRGTAITVHAAPEEWKPVTGWKNFEVSSWGRVRNALTGKLRALQPKGEWGHLKVTLHREGAQQRGANKKDFAVHTLVLQAFGPPRGAGAEARHLNGIAWDNTIRNLRWGNAKENREDAVLHGTMRGQARRGTQAKLTIDDVRAIRAAKVRPGYSPPSAKLTRLQRNRIRAIYTGARGEQTALAREYGVTAAAIHHVLNTPHEPTPDGVTLNELAKQYKVSRELIREIRAGRRWATETFEGATASFELARVTSIEVEASQITFGLSVNDDHSHVTGGIVTHNTGRLSCVKPGLHQLPRKEDGEGHTEGQLIKNCFIASPGYKLVQLDESQLELRVAAALSQDPVMMEMFNSGKDFHRLTAQAVAPIMWKMRPEDVGDAQRSVAKIFNFGLVYQMTDFGLARRLNCPVNEAERLRAAILGKFRVLAQWIRRAIAYAEKHGHAVTPFYWEPGRIRPLPDIVLSTTDEKTRGRQRNAAAGAVNTPCQSLGSDIVLTSMHNIVHQLVNDAGLDARVVLTVHDSIVAEVREDHVDSYIAMARPWMQQYDLRGVPLVVDVEIGDALGSLQKMPSLARAA